ncbi:DNA-directed RNA polymerase II core subunit [Dispira simplex]|nr:DNA-directed RNA polymerase II core subunit [Dispira simplex]
MNAPDFYEMFTLPEGVKKVAVHLDAKQPNAAIFEVQKEDHTLGNILTKLLSDPRVIFAGYRSPHPLEHKILIRVQTSQETNPTKAVRDAISSLLAELHDLRSRFEFDMARATAEQEARESSRMSYTGTDHHHSYTSDTGVDATIDANVDVDF